MPFKISTLAASVMLLAAGSATASDYFVVVPVKGRTATVPEQNIQVALNAYTLPNAMEGMAYSFNLAPLLTVTGDNAYTGAGVTWNVVSNTLPSGLYLTADGYIGGTPTSSGSGAITVRASYKNKNGEQTYQVVSLNIAVTLAAATLSNALVGAAYSYDFKPLLTVNGDATYTSGQVTWSLESGALPAGVSLNPSTGVLSGTPTSAANSAFTLKATYRTKTGQQAYTLVAVDAAQNKSYSMVAETNTISLTAPAGTTFRQVLFASYGTPTGTGPDYVKGSCHAASSETKVAEAFLNKSSGSIAATNATFSDPCVNTQKRLAIVLTAY